MTNEVVLATGIRALSSALGQVLQTYRVVRATKTAEMDHLRDSLTATRAMAKAGAFGALIRQNIEEIYKTQLLIENRRLLGAPLDYAMDQLRTLHQQLIANVEAFARG